MVGAENTANGRSRCRHELTQYKILRTAQVNWTFNILIVFHLIFAAWRKWALILAYFLIRKRTVIHCLLQPNAG